MILFQKEAVRSVSQMVAVCTIAATSGLAAAQARVASAPSAATASRPADTPPVTPFANIRYRLELVDQKGLPDDATASTLRIRAGLKTAEWQGLSALVEGEAIARIGAEHYNDTVNGRSNYPVVADPSDVLLNQAFIRFRPDARFEATAGRQAINLDNQRWIGSAAWRQNDQTLDSVRVTAKPIKNLTLDYLYAWRVNRILGPDSPQGVWRDSAIHSIRASAAIAPIGTVTGYAYLLDLPDAPTLSSRTFGLRIAGEPKVGKIKLLYAVEYARQQDHAGNPRQFSHDYLLIEPGIATGPITLRLGMERLEGDGTTALQTPLASMHPFNGWADKFLTTPPNGLRDLYADATVRLPRVAGVTGSTLRMVWHDYGSTRGSIAYGQEWNAMLTVPINSRLTAMMKFARYQADSFATDTTKGWLSLEFRY